jgi:hypothetical protein
MKVVLWIVLGLAVAVAVAWGAGHLLARDHVAARRIRVARGADEVFAVLDDRAQAPTWRQGIARVEVLDAERFVEHGAPGPSSSCPRAMAPW